MKIGVFYGSTTGVTEAVAKKVGDILKADVFDASNIEKISEYDTAILATSTWGVGDIQDDWVDSLEKLKNIDLSNKKIGIIGVGDQEAFSSSFVNGMNDIYQIIKDKGANIVGQTKTEGYNFDDTTAIDDGMFVGLVIDENNQADMTDERVNNWVKNFIS